MRTTLSEMVACLPLSPSSCTLTCIVYPPPSCSEEIPVLISYCVVYNHDITSLREHGWKDFVGVYGECIAWEGVGGRS